MRNLVLFSATSLLILACGSSETPSGTTSASSSVASSSSSSTSGGGSGGGSGGAGGSGMTPYEEAVAASSWKKLPKGPTVFGKQDDIWFLDTKVGFAASGPKFAILKTDDGGDTWNKVFSSPGTYFRALLFTDAQHGFAGNLGAGLSPDISDANVLYETHDGGVTWAAVTTITGAMPKGICNLTAADSTHLVGVGRANGPAHIIQSSDGGANWVGTDLSQYFNMLIDAHFTSPTEGIVAGMDKKGHCSIQHTADSGATFDTVFTSTTNSSLCWKLHFPSADVGYVAVQDAITGPGTFGKTEDGGKTWTEYPLPVTAKPKAAYPAIGVGFITDKIGWMSAEDPKLPSYRTLDGGMTWTEDTALKSPINRFRFVDKTTAYAIGGAVWKLDVAYMGN